MKRLAIITTHPIQYNAPLFSLLSQRGKVKIKIFYTWSQSQHGVKYDPGFERQVNWDIPLLEGYEYCFVNNIATDPGTHHFNGINNPALIGEIEEWKPDAILVFGWSFKSHLKCLRYFNKKLLVLFRGDSTLLNEKPGIRKMARRIFLKWVYSHVDVALYVGTQNKQYYLKHGLEEDQLVFAPHAVDNDRFYDKDGIYEEKAITWRHQLSIPPDDLIFLFAGKLEPVKNIELLINAFLKLDTKAYKQQGIHLIVVGNGILENEIKKKYHGSANLHFIDFQNQTMMPIVYRLGDVFLLTSKSETWGLCVNEAMACVKPVIVSDKCGCGIDLVTNGVNGYIFKSSSEADLLEKMKLTLDKKRLKEMGEQSKRIIQTWSFENICCQIEDIVSVK